MTRTYLIVLTAVLLFSVQVKAGDLATIFDPNVINCIVDKTHTRPYIARVELKVGETTSRRYDFFEKGDGLLTLEDGTTALLSVKESAAFFGYSEEVFRRDPNLHIRTAAESWTGTVGMYNITAAIDSQLLDLIDEQAPSYFNSSWNLNIDQFKAWLATIAWAEGKNGGYGAHSGAVGTDMFYHIVYPYNVSGGPFKFSTGIGPFQLDRGQPPENWQNWPTIDKLTPSLSVQSVLRWHNVYRLAGCTLADFATNSPWVAVRTPSAAWAEATGTSWDAHKNGNVALDWNVVRSSLSQNATDPSYRYNYSVESKGTMQWNIKASENVRTELGKLVVFDGGYDTWLVKSRKWDGTVRFAYYYACRRDIPVEVCVLDNESDPVNKFKYIFIRSWNTTSVGQNPEHVSGNFAGEAMLSSPAIITGDNPPIVNTFSIPPPSLSHVRQLIYYSL